MNKVNLIKAYAPLQSWLFEAALPIWSSAGHDPAGGFFERISLDGQPTHDPRRTRLVARQIFSFVAAREIGWPGPCDEMISHGLAFLHQYCIAPSQLCYSVVANNGIPLKPDFDTYDHAFAMFALAAVASAKHDPAVQENAAHAMLRAMTAKYAHPEAGFYECLPAKAPLLANPHMHLLEAALEWLEMRPGDALWGGLADELAELALSHLIDAKTGAIREYYDLNWQPFAEATEVVEPGHQFEWAWLLMRWSKLRDRIDGRIAALRLLEVGETYGVDEEGFVINVLDANLEVVDPDRRLWPQTERIKAHLIVGDIEKVVASLSRLAVFFETDIPGLWIETLTAEGVQISEPAKGSSLYHIVCALREVYRGLKL